MELRRVVVTGIGVVSPLGSNLPDFWNNVVEGKSGAEVITRFDPVKSATKTRFACQVKGFDITDYIDKKEARKLDPCAHFAVGAGIQAMTDSALDMANENPDRMGIILGIAIGGASSYQIGLDSLYNQRAQGSEEPKVTPFFIPQIISNMAAGYLSIMYGIKGPSYITASACASSNNSLIDSINLIRLGKADVILTGGAEAPLVDFGVAGFNAMRALSTKNDSPETASRPMSGSRDGFVLAEGGACLVFEEYEHAKARGAKIYAEVAGWGLSSDAYHITAPDPEGRGAVKVMQEAIADAGLTPDNVDYVNMHGTSTSLGDISECKAIQKLFGDHAYEMSLSATKSMTGHLLGGAGAIESVITVLAIHHSIVPPTINHTEGDEDPEIDYRLDFTFNKSKKRNIDVAISNTFGFGGHNACVLFKKVK